MIRFNNLSLQRGGKSLIEAADIVIQSQQRVGLIGANGCGKSSLFQLLLGQLDSDQGGVAMPAQTRMAHMAQEEASGSGSALDYVLDAHSALRQAQRAVAQAQQGHDDHALVEAFADLDAADEHGSINRAQRLLSGLGFSAAEQQHPVSTFSGGWRIRLNLARALMQPSELLLLDEPTNHLDLDATIWLEQWLKQYPGTLILISHDRDFLDAITTHIAHIEHQQLFLYSGNFSAFERQRAERLMQQQAAYEKQQQRIAEINRFVARFRAKASKAKQAQSRLKSLARMEEISAAHIDSPFHFSFPAAEKTSDPLLELRDAVLGYDADRPVLRLNLRIASDSRIGLLGRNGAGKSTLIKSLAGSLPLLAGERAAGAHLKLGYFAQHQMEALDIKASPALHIQRLSPRESEQSIRNYLGGFGFHGEQATGSIAHFSGGEKARLALAVLAWQRPNLIILDEPTNHLDIEMRHALSVALQSYNGAVILVSHDRHLLRTSLEEFLLVAEGSATDFEGSLDDYHSWLAKNQNQERKAEARALESQDRPGGSEGADKVDTKADKKLEKVDKKEQRRQAAKAREALKPLTRQLKQYEQAIAEKGALLKQIENKLADPQTYNDQSTAELLALTTQQAQLRADIETLEQQWLELSEQLESLSAASLENS